MTSGVRKFDGKQHSTRSNSSGRWREEPDTAKVDAEACRLFGLGYTYQQIADEIGWAHKASAFRAIERAYKKVVSPSAEMARKRSIERLDEAHQVARKVMLKDHVSISQGRVMKHPETEEILYDDGPKLSAVDRIVKIEAQLCAILGNLAPSKASVEVVTKDVIAERMEQLTKELQENDAAEEDTADADV